MTDTFEVGQILDGKVTGIQPYGAFVAISDNVQGLVHISEITHGYVKDVNEYLSVGDEVKVKVLQIDENSNKVSLSIRATEEAPKQQPKKAKPQQTATTEAAGGFNSLKDKLEEWIEQSKERQTTFKK